MPDTGAFHPHIVHFVIALLFVGVAFRLVSLTGRFAFTNHAATVLILLGTVAAFAAVKSGDDAHGPAERVPGARAAVVEHEEWGERARNAFIVVSLFELAALGLAFRKHRHARTAIQLASPNLTDTREMPWYVTTLFVSQPLHFGDYGGMPLKIIWAILDVITIIVLISGLYLWLKRRRRTVVGLARNPALAPAE